MRRIHPRALLTMTLLVALAPVGAQVALGDDARAPAEPLPEHVSVPDPPEPSGEAPIEVAEPFTVPANAGTKGCAAGWTRFENPVLNYRMCIPPGWGFTDFASDEPLQEIPSTMLESLHLVSDHAFPWRPGDLPFDAVERGMIDVELNVLEAGARSTSECEPSERVPVGRATFLTCEQTYDALGLPAAVGPLRALKVAIPLPTTPMRIDPFFDPRGARLLAIARTEAAHGREASLAWRVIQSIRAL